MMNTILKIITVISLITILFMACDDKEIDGNMNTNPSGMVSFAQDTFYFPEDSLNAAIPIVVPKYVNGTVQLILECENGTAKRDTHFYIDLLEAKIPIGGKKIDFPIEIFDDSIMNINRSFKLKLSDVSGAAYAGLERQECVIIIENDDFPAEATAVFSESEIVVSENDGEIKIPFKIIGDTLKGDATIMFGYDQSIGSATIRHFKFKDEGKVSLKKGDSTGFVVLEIINNHIQGGDVWTDIFMTEAEGVLTDKGMSTCRLTIKEDDITRTIGFSVVQDTALENVGLMEISVEIKGPKFKEPDIVGEVYFLGHDSLSANRGLKILDETKFAVRGDTILTFTIEITDNNKFETWGDSLGFRGLINEGELETGKDKLYLTIADDEREVNFVTSDTTFNEDVHMGGVRSKLFINLEGGVALEDTEVRLTILNSTTPEGTYEIPDVITIKAGSDNIHLDLWIKKNPSKLDTYFEIKLESMHSSTLMGQDSTCKVNILNTDANVLFSTKPQLLALDIARMSIEAINLPSKVSGTIEVIPSDGVEASGFIPTFFLDNDKNTHDFLLNIKNTKEETGKIIVRITELKDSDADTLLDIISPDFYETIIYVAGNTDIPMDMEYIDRSSWTVALEASNAGEGFDCAKIIDNEETTYWHTAWQGEGAYPEPPYFMVFDMQRNVYARQLEFINNDRASRMAKVITYVSLNENGPWELIHTLINDEDVGHITLKDDVDLFTVGRYVKLEVTGNLPAEDVATMSEFKIFGNLIEE